MGGFFGGRWQQVVKKRKSTQPPANLMAGNCWASNLMGDRGTWKRKKDEEEGEGGAWLLLGRTHRKTHPIP